MTFTAMNLLKEISEYEVGNTDKIFTSKELKSRFSKINLTEITDFISSCGSAISEIKKNPCINDQQKNDLCYNVLSFDKLARPIANKKMKESWGGKI